MDTIITGGNNHPLDLKAYRTEVRDLIADHPINRIDGLLPWRWRWRPRRPAQAAAATP
jgi:hypothetical protein